MRASRRLSRYGAPRTALALTIVALAACGGEDNAAPSAAEAIDRSVEATGAETTFSFDLNVENPPRSPTGLNLTHADGEVAVPDRLRADVAGTFVGIPLESELVTIGRDEWLKNPFGGGFRKIDIGISPLDFFDPDSGVLAVLANAEDVQLAVEGDEYVITGDVAAESVDGFLGVDADDRQLDVEVRMGKDDYLLHRVSVKGPANESEPADVERVIELSNYGEDVTIEAPE